MRWEPDVYKYGFSIKSIEFNEGIYFGKIVVF